MKPLFYEQETISSCVPACLRMVLSAFSFEITEAELREACDCTPFGTDALKAVDAARRIGFARTGKHTLSLEELVEVIDSGRYPIVLVSMLPIDGVRETHSLVVIAIDQNEITVYDPAKGERIISRQTFSAA